MAARWMVVVFVASAAAARAAHADAPAPSQTAVTGIAVVSGTTCALHADGNVSCWGRELDRTQRPTGHSRPVGVPVFHDVVQLDGVVTGICARYRDGTVRCLGMTPTSPGAPEPQPLHDIVELRGNCALGGDGHVTCFDGTAWAAVPHVDDAIAVDSRAGNGCAIHKDTTVSCWAADGQHAAVVGAAADGSAQLVAGVTGAVQVSVGLFSGCARLRDGRVTCWGNNVSGELGRGAVDTDYALFHKPALVANVTDAVDLMAGAVHACIRRKAGPLACWGEFPWDVGKKHPSVTVIRPLDHVTAMAGGDQTCAVGKGRDVWCMGTDRDGQLGNGLSEILDAALPIPGVRDATQILATTLGTCALRGKGELTCWGEHDNGPAKLRGMQHLSQATRVFSGTYLTGLDAQGRLWVDGEDKPRKLPKGTAHAGVCVIANGGEVWCNAIAMGSRGPVSGQLAGVTDAVEIVGSNRMTIRHRTGAVSTFTADTALSGGAPVAVSTIADATALAAGESGSACAIRADHTAWCWGDTNKPVQLPGVTDVVALAISDQMPTESAGYSCAVKVDGSVACWGENGHGQLGDGTRTASKMPVAVRGVTDAIQVATGWLHACALEKSGAIACWGSTEEGAGGTPRTDRIDHPVAVLWP